MNQAEKTATVVRRAGWRETTQMPRPAQTSQRGGARVNDKELRQGGVDTPLKIIGEQLANHTRDHNAVNGKFQLQTLVINGKCMLNYLDYLTAKCAER